MNFNFSREFPNNELWSWMVNDVKNKYVFLLDAFIHGGMMEIKEETLFHGRKKVDHLELNHIGFSLNVLLNNIHSLNVSLTSISSVVCDNLENGFSINLSN